MLHALGIQQSELAERWWIDAISPKGRRFTLRSSASSISLPGLVHVDSAAHEGGQLCGHR
jgi:hypothetical protein